MAKIKLPSKPPRIDMTPMVDLFFLLLTFFMLTTSFTQQEAVQVDTPKSISEKLSPMQNVLTISISKDNRVFFNIDNGKDSTQHIRKRILQGVGKYYGIKFADKQLAKFEQLSSFGMPVANMGAWINAESTQRDKMQIGIPIDSLNNQLTMWIRMSRELNPAIEAAVKGDAGADYNTAKKVFDILVANNLMRFNLTTTLNKVDVKLDTKK
jgi:biopolymer transport protein ExbD